jgi:hypothetical protein
MKIKIIISLVVLNTCIIPVFSQQSKWFLKGVMETDPQMKIEYFSKSLLKDGPIATTFFNRGLVYA